MLVEVLLETARRLGSAPAVADPQVRLTYRQLVKFAQVIRTEVLARSRSPRVGIMLPACTAFPACLFGTLWAGRVVVPLNFLLSSVELRKVIEAAGLDLVITVRHFEELLAGLPVAKLYLDAFPLKRKLVFSMVKRTPEPPGHRPDDTAVLLFTSGTAAEPKGVELTFRNLLSNCQDCIATAKMEPGHRFLNCLPPFHVFGLTANVIAPVVLGSSTFCLPRFQPTAVAKALLDEQISIYMAIPSMHGALLRLKSAPADLFRRAYLVVSGGEPLPEALAKGFQERFGVRLLQGYGLTETSPVCTLEVPEAHKDGSIGRPIHNVSVRIVSASGGDAPVGADGEIWVKGPNVMKGYFGRPEETARVVTPDGWFRTGDSGRFDAEGFVTITGRLKEIMIVGGENVFPREIEAVLEQHPAVADVAVIGVRDESRGEVPVAYVTLKEGASATDVELREFARERLAGYKVPRRVRIEAELPRSPVGKILKRKLAELEGAGA